LSFVEKAPTELDQDFDHRDALFGSSPFGKEIESNIFYTTKTLCDDEPSSGAPASIEKEGYILMINRGGCSFVEKVRNAQNENATAVIFADNKCLCRSGDACVSQETCEDFEPVLDDDGTGDDIEIPSMMLMKQDAETLRDKLMFGTMIRVKLSWPAPKAVDGPVEYSLWTTPDDLMSAEFLSTFKEAAVALGDKARFVPQMYINDGTEKECRYSAGAIEPCPGKCTNFGRYCEPKSYYDLEQYDQKGTLMVVESLRRQCIWHMYGSFDGVGVLWWDYVEQWMLQCSKSHYSVSCAEKVFEQVGLDERQVNKCMNDAGNFWTDGRNILMDNALNARAQDEIFVAPTAMVNGAALRGRLTYGSMLNAICWALPDGQDKPAICSQWATCSALCPTGQRCVLNADQCVEYKVFLTIDEGAVYDDDFIDWEGWPTSEPSSAPVPPPTKAPVSLEHQTIPPTVEVMEIPVVNPAPEEPVSIPVKAPVAPPVAEPVPGPTYPVDPPSRVVPIPTGGNDRIVETIQIFENGGGGGGGGGGTSIAFAAGLGAGIGGVVIIGLLMFIVFRERNRNVESMRPLMYPPSVAASGMSHYEDRFEDEGSVVCEDGGSVTTRISVKDTDAATATGLQYATPRLH
jgi:hypothetical protein